MPDRKGLIAKRDQQPRQMLLILRSSAASSRLAGVFGLLRLFSEGTWSARGCLWPIGASGIDLDWRVEDPVPEVCAIATELKINNATVVISFRI
jgi:hypothetical protein